MKKTIEVDFELSNKEVDEIIKGDTQIIKDVDVDIDIYWFEEKQILERAAEILREMSDNDAEGFCEEFAAKPTHLFEPQNLHEEQEFEEFIERMENKRKAL